MDHGLIEAQKLVHTEYIVVPQNMHLFLQLKWLSHSHWLRLKSLTHSPASSFQCFFRKLWAALKMEKVGRLQHIIFTINPLSSLTLCSTILWTLGWGLKAYNTEYFVPQNMHLFCSWSGSVTVIGWGSKAWRIHLPVHPSVSSGSSGLP